MDLDGYWSYPATNVFGHSDKRHRTVGCLALLTWHAQKVFSPLTKGTRRGYSSSMIQKLIFFIMPMTHVNGWLVGDKGPVSSFSSLHLPSRPEGRLEGGDMR